METAQTLAISHRVMKKKGPRISAKKRRSSIGGRNSSTKVILRTTMKIISPMRMLTKPSSATLRKRRNAFKTNSGMNMKSERKRRSPRRDPQR